MSLILDTSRALFAVIQPQTGTRSSGNVTATATGGNVLVPRNSHLIPVVDNRIRPDRAYKTDAGPEPNEEWDVAAAGTSVGLISVLGGVRHDLPTGTVLRWDPPIAGVNPTVVVEAPGISGGADPTFFGGLKSVVMIEDFTGPAKTLEAFRSKIGPLPAALLQWDSSEPATGTTIPGLDRGGSRTRRDTQLYKEKFALWILTNRKDTAHARRREGLQILDDLTELLVDRQSVDGCGFSSPDGLQILERNRVSLDRSAFQELNLYEIRLATTRSLRKVDARQYSDLLKIRMQVTVDDELVHDPDQPITVVDVTADLS